METIVELIVKIGKIFYVRRHGEDIPLALDRSGHGIFTDAMATWRSTETLDEIETGAVVEIQFEKTARDDEEDLRKNGKIYFCLQP